MITTILVKYSELSAVASSLQQAHRKTATRVVVPEAEERAAVLVEALEIAKLSRDNDVVVVVEHGSSLDAPMAPIWMTISDVVISAASRKVVKSRIW